MAETIGERIRRRREAAKLSQYKLAPLLGTTRQRVILWEKDKHAPSPAYAAKLARHLGGDRDDYLPPAYEPLTLQAELDDLRAQVRRLAKAVGKIGRGQDATAELIASVATRVDALEARGARATRARPS